ncbi:hypothetical protein ACHAWF_009177 [Thalassiosira exigua]
MPALSILLGRMNPAVCLSGGGLSAVHDEVERRDEGLVASASDDVRSASEDRPSDGGDDPSRSHKSRDGPSSTRRKRTSFGPVGCVSPCEARYRPDDDEDEPLSPEAALSRSLGRMIPGLLASISFSPPPSSPSESAATRRRAAKEFDARRSRALRELHNLTAKGNERYRVPMVRGAEGRWDVVGAFAGALLASAEAAEAEADKTTIDGGTGASSRKGAPDVDEDRRLICWTLNNLSIPYENKSTVVHGDKFALLLRALTTVIRLNLPETYLCCICLLNLTFATDAVRPVTFYVPPAYENGSPPYSPHRSRSCGAGGARDGGPSPGRTSSGGRPPTSPFSRARSHHVRPPTPRGNNSAWAEGRMSEISALVLGNSASLIRVLERMMAINAPYLMKSKVQSVQGEAIRWSCGLVRNVTTSSSESNDADGGEQGSDGLTGCAGRRGTIPDEAIEEICLLISQTEIPRLMVQFVRDSPHQTVKWTKDSLEDICLGAMCNIAQWESSQEALKRAGTVECLESIEGLPGIHGYRARAIRCSLGALPMKFG